MNSRLARRRAPLAVLLCLSLLPWVAAPAAADSHVRTIGEVQGTTTDSENGAFDRSPFAGPRDAPGDMIAVRGVVTQKRLYFDSRAGDVRGFWLQSTTTTADGDPNTSDGIFVFTGTSPTLTDGYAPVVGDDLVIEGQVYEFFNETRITNASVAQVVRTGVDLAAEVPAIDAQPPDHLAAANRYWERREGMRFSVPAGSLALNGRNVFPPRNDGEVWVVRPDHEIAQRSDPYARRSFRDAHPLDNEPGLFDDGNGYRILLGSHGLKGSANDIWAVIAPARTFSALESSVVGPLGYNFSKYTVHSGSPASFAPGVDPAANNPPRTYPRDAQYSVASFNVENLYDFRDDPNDGCDFADDAGCAGVNPPFDYVPSSNEAYQTRVGEIAAQITGALHAPDLLLIQEAEDQDICTAGNGALTCGSGDDADGSPDTLQELALAIQKLGGPHYAAAYDRDGADDRGIVSAFMYRTDRVELLPPDAGDPILGSSPDIDYPGGLAYNTDVQNPKVLNADLPAWVDRSTRTDGDDVYTRPPQIGLFRVWRDGIGQSVFSDLYAASNHFSSTPNQRVGQRTEQARYLALMVQALESADDDARVLLGGDFNVYPRPDDPFAPGERIGTQGQVGPSDQLGALYDDALMTNLWDSLVATHPEAAYSYVFQGQAQTLDMQFVNRELLMDFVEYRIAHVNADFPADYPGDGPRGTSDHDPSASRLSTLPNAERLADLVEYLADAGLIDGERIEAILLDRLERAERYRDADQERAYLAQLEAFLRQLAALTPRFVEPDAAELLEDETKLLLSLG